MKGKRTGVANKNPKPENPESATLFSFRLPVKYMNWFKTHTPPAGSRHLRMQAFVVSCIQKQPDYEPDDTDPIVKLNERVNELEAQMYISRDELRDYVTSLIRDNKRLAVMQEANETYQDSEIPDDLINNMLEGLGR